MINFNKLYYFKMIVDMGSISKAAESLFISQSGLSKALRELEEELECELFIRHGRRLELNIYGKTLLKKVNEIFMITDNIKPDLEKLRFKEREVLKIDTYYSFPIEFLFQKIIGFFPNIRLNVKQSFNSPHEIISDTFSGKTDIALISLSEEETVELKDAMKKQNIEYIFLLKEDLYLSAPKSSPLADIPSCKLSEIDLNRIIGNTTPTYREIWFINVLKSKKIDFNYIHNLNYATFMSIWKETMYYYLTTSLYLCHKDTAFDFRKYRTLIRIDAPEARRNVYLLYNKKTYAFLKPFINDLLMNFYKQFSSKNIIIADNPKDN